MTWFPWAGDEMLQELEAPFPIRLGGMPAVATKLHVGANGAIGLNPGILLNDYAKLPLAMQRMTEFGVPRRIVAFVMPTGYSFNLDGSTLYLGVASIFVAQAAGVDLTVGQQLVMMLTLLITSKGIAAVPRASLIVLSGTLTAFGLPLEGVAVILGVDELMDMARTMVNLVGNCLATAVMARWEGELQA